MNEVKYDSRKLQEAGNTVRRVDDLTFALTTN